VRAQAKNPADAALAADIGSFTHDPLGYVTYAFPWGTGELEQHHGPRRWQREKLQQIGEHLRTNRTDPIQLAVASGHGIGNLAAFDANNNAVDSGVATSSLYNLGGTVNVDSCTLGPAAGSGTSCSATGVDAAHIVTVTMGSGTTSTGNLVTITLATNRPRPTLAVCSYSPSTGAAATDYSKSIIVGNAANQYTIAFPGSAPTASVTYTWSVTCP